jgi:hypothetical protein
MPRFHALLALLFATLLPGLVLAQEAGAKPAAPTSEQTPDKAPAAVTTTSGPRPEVLYDPGLLPEPVRKMRDMILEAARSGDPDKLKVAIQSNEMPPAFSFADESDPIAAMKTESADGTGLETMAILTEILEAGYVHVDKGTPQEMYVWPYFAQYPLDALTPAQTVELYRIVTSFDLGQMKEFGAYNFYRVGISPDGVWHFFVAGD